MELPLPPQAKTKNVAGSNPDSPAPATTQKSLWTAASSHTASGDMGHGPESIVHSMRL